MKNYLLVLIFLLSVNSLSMASDTITTKSGLKYIKVRDGNGKQPVKGSSVKVHYKGTLRDGKVFDSSYDASPFKFTVANKEVIPGWDEGVQLMSEGEKAVLVIPSNLGYGKKGVKDEDSGKYIIPPDATLIFEIELLKVK